MKINWEIIRQDYIQGYKEEGKLYYPSMRDLSKKYGIDIGTIGRQAKKNEWVAKKEIYLNKKTTRSQQKTIENFSDETSRFDIKCFTGARNIIEATELTIDTLKGKKDKTEILRSKDIRDLKGLTEIRLNAQKEAKLALGEAPEDKDLIIKVEWAE